MEHAAGGRVQRAGHLALERLVRALRLDPRVRDRHRREQRPGVGVQRIVEELVRFGQLDHLAQVHHRDPVAEVVDDAQIVGDEEVGELELLAQVFEQVDDLGLDGHVQRRHRLVADDELRVQAQRPGDPHPLALAAAHLVRVAVRELRGQPAYGEQLGDPAVAPARVRLDAVDAHRLVQDGADLHAGVERAVRVLEDDLDLLPPGGQLLVRQAFEVDALEHDLPRGGAFELEHATAGRGLAAAGFPDQAEGLALPDVEAHPVHRLDVADGLLEHQPLGDREVFPEVSDFEQGLAPGHGVALCDGAAPGGGAGRGRCGTGGRSAHAAPASSR